MITFDSLQADSPLSYLIAFIMPALDAVFPALPGETVVIALGVATAGSADPRIALLVGCAAAGAFIGDNLCYLLGRRFGPAVRRRFFTTQKGAKAHKWAERSLSRYGPQLIVVCRFIPGGRTAVTLTCGLIGYPRRRFIIATAVAAVIWALYAFFVGRIGGQAFEDNQWAGLAIAFGASIAISVIVEAVRRLLARRRSRGHVSTGSPRGTDRPCIPAGQSGLREQQGGRGKLPCEETPCGRWVRSALRGTPPPASPTTRPRGAARSQSGRSTGTQTTAFPSGTPKMPVRNDGRPDQSPPGSLGGARPTRMG